MRLAIINLTGGRMSEGYQKYLRNIIPVIASNLAVEAVLCAYPPSITVKDWFKPLSNVKFVTCQPYRFLNHKHDTELHKQLNRFSPDVIYSPI
jgi:hypothetical protein